MSVSSPVPLAVPNLGDDERHAVQEALDSGFVSSAGPLVRSFEDAFARAVGAEHAVACSSGTAALHVALRLAGVGPGDLVAISDFTFVASANAALYLGATPLLVDAERATWCLDPALLLEDIDRRLRTGEPLPKVIEPVHVLGQPADIEELAGACLEHDIVMVEDAAESLGARWTTGVLGGRHTGTVGRLGCFSFNGNKIMTTGGGGMIVTDDLALAERARHLTTQARVDAVGYLHDEVGYNYRLPNLAAALGLAQLGRLESFIQAKHRVAERYREGLADLPLTQPPSRPGTSSTYWLYSVLVDGPEPARERDALLRHLEERGVQARPLWRPLHAQPPLSSFPVLGGAVGDDLFNRGLSLPCSTGISDADLERALEAVRSFYCAG